MHNEPITPVKDQDKGSIMTPKRPGGPRTMDFPDAIRAVTNGDKISRISWGSGDYGILNDGWLSIFTKGQIHTWSVNQGDLEGQDWVIVRSQNGQN